MRQIAAVLHGIFRFCTGFQGPYFVIVLPSQTERVNMFRCWVFLVGLCLLGGCSHPKGVRKVSLAAGERASDHFFRGTRHVIATQGRASTLAGRKMYRLGGNGADAAAAISFAISVERPQSTGIGGGGFLLLRRPGHSQVEAWDFREKAPLKSHARMFLDKTGKVIKDKSLVGIHAAGVPGLVAGVLEFHARYGKLPLAKVLAPAIELAERGFLVYPELARALELKGETLKKFPATKKIFFKEGRVLEKGDLLVQKDLAKTLRSIARQGRKGFYEGWVAKAIVREGGITHKDLRNYDVKKRVPIGGSYKGRDIFSMGPPSSGGIHLVQILNILEGFQLKEYGPHHPQSVHWVASAMQQAFADRAEHLGDIDFVQVPVEQLTSKRYAARIARQISKSKARERSSVTAGDWSFSESDQTTHFSLMDSEGWAVSSTQTINGYFGSSMVVAGTGIILNNEMDDFAVKVGAANLFQAMGGSKNLPAPGKRPLSSMSPTIVMKKGRPVLVLGSPSGTRIITCVVQTILNHFEYGLSLKDSVALVRYHHQWFPDEIRTDTRGLPAATEAALKEMGHTLRRKNLGCRIQAVGRSEKGLLGVSDIRGRGLVSGE